MRYQSDNLKSKIARQVQQDMSKWGDIMPSLTSLAKFYNVGWNTIQGAIALLQNEGILHGGRGRRIRIQKPVDQVPQIKINSFDKAINHITTKISDGTYRSGNPLPKVFTLCKELGCSNKTLQKVLNKLTFEGVLYKHGMRYFVGKSHSTNIIVSVNAPIMFIISRDASSWIRLINERTGAFCYQFEEEALRYQTRIIQFAIKEEIGLQNKLTEANFLTAIKSYGDSYHGTLLINSKSEFENFESWINFLSIPKKPVIWFDRYNETWGKPSRPNIIRCHYSEKAAIELAIKLLYDNGHREIAYPRIQNDEWIDKRLDLIKKISESYDPPLKIYSNVNCMDLWETNSKNKKWRTQWSSLLKIWYSRNPLMYLKESISKVSDWLLGDSNEFSDIKHFIESDLMMLMGPVLHDIHYFSKCTAILAPNDWHARKFYAWFKSMLIKIPDEISILSFDNYRARLWNPVSSIDFGFGYLGYACFHTILNDVHFKKDKTNSIPSQPRFVDRGSFGRILSKKI